MSWRQGSVALGLVTMMMIVVAGCGERGAGSAEHEPEHEQAGVVYTYEVRGQIVQMPAGPGQDLLIHHEAIPEFRNSDGEIAPMPAMAMPFPPAPGVSLEGLAVGDKVLATLEVQWEPTTGWAMTAIEELPADTALDLGSADHDHEHHNH